MWNGYLDALKLYYNAFWQHCVDFHKIKANKLQLLKIPDMALIQLPPWIGNQLFHAAHRSNLLRKDPVYYVQFGWTEPDNLDYVWPVDRDGKLCI